MTDILEELDENFSAEGCWPESPMRRAAAEIRTLRARVAELEAQLAAVGKLEAWLRSKDERDASVTIQDD